MEQKSIATETQHTAHTNFLGRYPPESLPIPSQYRKFYRSLLASPTDDPNIGDVIPFIPDVISQQLNADNGQLAPIPLFTCVPATHLLIRAMSTGTPRQRPPGFAPPPHSILITI